MSTRSLAAALLLCAVAVFGQARNPVQWTADPVAVTAPPGGSVAVKLHAKLDDGWHIYALTNPSGGPMPTTVKVAPANDAIAGLKLYQPKPEVVFDANFNMNTEAFEHQVDIIVLLAVATDAKAGETEVPLLVRYQACTDKECLPKKITLPVKLTVDKKAQAAVFMAPAGMSEFTGPSKQSAQPAPASQEKQAAADQGLAAFLLVAFGFGLAAIFTPCVFPMIPITLSFFLNRPGALKQAIIFCLGIVVLFSAMGVAVTALAGPFGVVQLGSNPWVNAFIATVFIFFGLSLLGAFEITLPSGLLTKMNQASERGGMLGTLLMGLTFSLTSFACVGPFVGTLLAGSVQRGGLQPVLGMAAFAAGLASPFFVLALFPSYLQRLPRSGGWMARVKVVLGFIILAAALKYITSVDQVLQWNLLTRERFLAAWFVLFSLPGLYLLGLLKMEGIRADENVGVARTLTGAAFLIFAISLLPGMFGARLGELDSYVPLAGQTVALSGGGTEGLAWMKNDFDGAVARARQEGKRVFVSFTGYACTNCHWMKANMLSRPEIAGALKNYVLVELYTDGTDAASEANQKLQESKFGTVAIPYYAIFDGDGRAVSTFAGLTRNAPEYLAFLTAPAASQTAAQGQ